MVCVGRQTIVAEMSVTFRTSHVVHVRDCQRPFDKGGTWLVIVIKNNSRVIDRKK